MKACHHISRHRRPSLKVRSEILYSETFKVCRVYDHCDNRLFIIIYLTIEKLIYSFQ